MEERGKSIFYSKELILVGAAFLISFLLLFFEWRLPETQSGRLGTGYSWLAQAYAFHRHGISNTVGSANFIAKNFRLIDVPQEKIVFTTVPFYDPILFSIFCALVWKIIGIPTLLILKVINIFIFSALTILLFCVLRMLLREKKYAFIGSLGCIAYLPLVYENIQNVRDVYHYYAFIIFLYFVLTYAFKKREFFFLIPGIVAFCFCHWVRPCLLSSFVVLTVLFFVFAFFYLQERKRILKAVISFWVGSAILFWVPFFIFNKITYDRYYIMCTGEAKLSSLYGVPFPDGDFVEHTNSKFVFRKRGFKIDNGSGESGDVGMFLYDNLCMSLYKEYKEKYPFHPIQCMMARFKQMLWYDLPWRQYDPYKTTVETSRWVKFQLMFNSPILFLEFFARLYIRILLVFAYLGIVLAFMRKEYWLLVFLVLGVIFSSGYSWLYHIEERVLAVHNWPFGIFAAYFAGSVYECIFGLINKRSNRRWHLASTGH